MKQAKTLLVAAVAFALTLCMGSAAFASDAKGSITIDGAVEGQTYAAYRILDLESFSDADGDGEDSGDAYAYRAAPAWESWLRTQIEYVAFDEQGYVTWVEDADVAEFAKEVQAQAASAGIDPDAGPLEATSTTVTFADLPLGYYLVDSTLGVLCALDTTNPNMTISEKNEAPTILKQVKEDSTGAYGSSCTAQIGDEIEFKTTISLMPGAQNYVLHDRMAEGLTLDEDSVEIEGLINGVQYTLSTGGLCEDCSFHIVFKQTYLDTITEKTDLTLTYTATLNGSASMATVANANDAMLTYGEGAETVWSTANVFTHFFDLVKTNSANALLEGAQFALYDASAEGNQIALVKESDGVYRVATSAEKAAAGFVSAVIEGAQAAIEGLDADTTYWLEEVAAPAGYNKLASRVEIAIAQDNLVANVEGGVWQSGGVHVINQTGAELPSTGGAGTTALYLVGTALTAGAIVLLLVRKRRSEQQ